MTNILNSELTTGSFLRIWKQAEVKPLPKTSNPKLYKDYRPITLLFHLSKITEMCIKTELTKHIPIDTQKFAYTQALGTTDALVKIITDTATALDNESTYGVQCRRMLEFSKAFD